jgi:hypothetical protein
VTIVEFNDLKCPICRQYSQQTLPALVQDDVRTGKVKMVMRLQHFVGEQYAPGESLRAAEFADAAAFQNKAWSFAELFYDNQQDETTRYVTGPFLRKIGSAIPGLSVATAMRQRSAPQVATQIQQAGQQFQANGFTGTPSFLIGRSGGPLRPLAYTSLESGTFPEGDRRGAEVLVPSAQVAEPSGLGKPSSKARRPRSKARFGSSRASSAARPRRIGNSSFGSARRTARRRGSAASTVKPVTSASA